LQSKVEEMDQRDRERYSRQILFKPIGLVGQEKLRSSRVAIVGMGALGSVLANHMVRAGIGYLRMIDRDFVEESNLQRQMLYDESDARDHLPKAVAAASKLRKINASVTLDAVVTDLHAFNAERYLHDVDLILDGTDNFQIRYLINDVSVKHRIPWVYGGAVGARGMFTSFRPPDTPCYRCLFPHIPGGRGETCDTVGVIGPIIHIIASYQAAEGLKLLIGATEQRNPNLEQFDLWHNEHVQIDCSMGKHENCPACGMGVYSFLEQPDEYEDIYTTLCGRDTVQITNAQPRSLDLQELYNRLSTIGQVERNAFLLRFHIDSYTLVIFPDGRVMVQGTQDIALARTLYAKYVGY
jgi:molybdopterin/thiamine biosynthesis adenylyltransferase